MCTKGEENSNPAGICKEEKAKQVSKVKGEVETITTGGA